MQPPLDVFVGILRLIGQFVPYGFHIAFSPVREVAVLLSYLR